MENASQGSRQATASTEPSEEVDVVWVDGLPISIHALGIRVLTPGDHPSIPSQNTLLGSQQRRRTNQSRWLSSLVADAESALECAGLSRDCWRSLHLIGLFSEHEGDPLEPVQLVVDSSTPAGQALWDAYQRSDEAVLWWAALARAATATASINEPERRLVCTSLVQAFRTNLQIPKMALCWAKKVASNAGVKSQQIRRTTFKLDAVENKAWDLFLRFKAEGQSDNNATYLVCSDATFIAEVKNSGHPTPYRYSGLRGMIRRLKQRRKVDT